MTDSTEKTRASVYESIKQKTCSRSVRFLTQATQAARSAEGGHRVHNARTLLAAGQQIPQRVEEHLAARPMLLAHLRFRAFVRESVD
jgi:hypothetical protein